MKAILPYIIMFAGSLVLVSLFMGGLYWYRPDLLGFAPPAAAAKADSSAVRHPVLPMCGPTLAELKGKDVLTLTRDSLTVMRDSITALGRMLSRELALADSLRNVSRAPVAAADSAVAPPKNVGNDGKDRKAMTKMLESMTAENVVKLLHGMSDEEVKGLLLSLKTKQAAKILAALDPDRAAKLIR